MQLDITGLTTRLYTLLPTHSIDSIRLFGLRSPPPQHRARHHPLTTALIHTYATWNSGSALTTLGLTAFWQMQVKGM
jgi:hypothetical protein